MIPHVVSGKGISGALAYVMGQGNDPETGKRKELEDGQESRAVLLGGQNFGFEVKSADDLDLARKIMEWSALPENQASKTRKCVKDCLHMSLSWEAGQDPSREEMVGAAQSALKSLGMENARAVFVAHNDTTHPHLHLVASRIDPETGKTFSDTLINTKAVAWGLQWEKEKNQVSAARAELHGIADAVQKRDKSAILDHLTERQSTFTAKELDKVLAYGLPDQEERGKFRLDILADQQVVGLRDTAESEVTRYTTRDVLKAERAVMNAAERLEVRQDHGVSARRVAVVAKFATLNDEQRNAMQWACEAGGFAMIAGEAGTGKSRTLGAIRDAYEESGKRVIGMAWTNAVVQDMRGDGFKEAVTIASELKRQEGARAQKWDKNTVLMIDEAAMLSTKTLASVMTKAADAGAKVILAGDDKQLASIERGGLFGVLSEQHGAAELKQVQRTKDKDQQRAFNQMHAGEFRDALATFDKKGAIHWQETQKDALRATAEKYAAAVAADATTRRFIFAYTNADVDKLNEFARGLARHHGQLGDDVKLKTSHGEAAFAKGDRVQFTGNAADRKGKNAGLVNGAVGTVRKIEEKKNQQIMTVELDGKKGEQPKVVKFAVGEDKTKNEFNAIRHGYAGTIYKGQGRTLDDVYVYHSQHWRAASAYVALTRHRESVNIFVSTDTLNGRPPVEPWMMQTGGAAELDEAHRASAQKSFGSWAEANPRPAAKYGFDGYVQYVQDQWAKKESGQESSRESDLDRLGKQMQRADQKRAASAYALDPTIRAELDAAANQNGPRAAAMREARQSRAGFAVPLAVRQVAPLAQSAASGVEQAAMQGAMRGASKVLGILGSLLNSLMNGFDDRPVPRQAVSDPSKFSDAEMDQRRAALLQRFGRDMPVEMEQTAERDERIRRESGQSQQR